MKSYKDFRLIFMGTPDISAKLLNALIENKYQIVGVVTRLDAPVGRKKVLTPPPVKEIALKHNIPVYQFKKVKDEYEVLLGLHADAIVCLAYGQIIPMGLIEAMPIGCLNFHGSLLPKYRGAAPLQRAIMNGEKESGCTAMEMVKEMDAGVMYDKVIIPIDESDNFTSYREKFIQSVIPFALEVLPKYLNKTIKGIEQDVSEVSFANMISKDDIHLDINMHKIDFVNMVRGLSVDPGGFLILNNETLKIYQCRIVSNEVNNEIGKIIKADKDGLYLQLKDGVINLDLVQLPGKKILGYRDFVNGTRDLLGKLLA